MDFAHNDGKLNNINYSNRILYFLGCVFTNGEGKSKNVIRLAVLSISFDFLSSLHQITYLIQIK